MQGLWHEKNPEKRISWKYNKKQSGDARNGYKGHNWQRYP